MFHSKEAGQKNTEWSFLGMANSHLSRSGVPGLPCPQGLEHEWGSVAMVSMTLQLGPDHLAPRRWSPGLGER